MTVLDLTHLLAPGMPVYPGADAPDLRQVRTVARDGWDEKWIGLSSHHGTHMDAPAHMLEGAPTLDRMEAGRFLGRGWAADVSALGGGCIGPAVLEAHREAIEGCDFVLFHTGWAARWGREDYFRDFPVLAPDAAQWLGERGLKGIGFDTVSADPVGADSRIHRILFRAGLVLIENLTGLDALLGRSFQFICLPLKVAEADGSPVRAVALVD